MARRRDLPLVLLFAALFLALAALRPPLEDRNRQSVLDGQVVITAPVQTLLFGGDRYLAADIETIRAAALGSDTSDATAYRLRAHRVVAELNPCHEDNYYLANALLTWGGSEREGNEVVEKAMACRSWDEMPPFIYGFNLYFFGRHSSEAAKALEIAASRATDNAAAMRKLAIMINVESLNDDQMALDYLRQQRRTAKDPKLIAMLDKRLIRLEGLVTLREGQRRYEQRFGKPLHDPRDLLSSGLLQQFPSDPLGLGYEYHEGKFRLRTLQIQGLEDRP